MKYTLSACLLFAASACGASTATDAASPVEPDEAHIALAETRVPVDEPLAAIYERSCRACHALNGLGAPLTGHSAAWEPRFTERGADGLIQSVKTGRGTMPAMGYCADCSDDDLRALITFMSTEGL